MAVYALFQPWMIGTQKTFYKGPINNHRRKNPPKAVRGNRVNDDLLLIKIARLQSPLHMKYLVLKMI